MRIRWKPASEQLSWLLVDMATSRQLSDHILPGMGGAGWFITVLVWHFPDPLYESLAARSQLSRSFWSVTCHSHGGVILTTEILSRSPLTSVYLKMIREHWRVFLNMYQIISSRKPQQSQESLTPGLTKSAEMPSKQDVLWTTRWNVVVVPTRKHSSHSRERRPEPGDFNQKKRDSWRNYVSQLTTNTPIKHVWDRVRKISGKNICPPKQYLRGKDGKAVTTPRDVANEHAAAFAGNSSSAHYSQEFLQIKEEAEKENFNFESQNTEVYNKRFRLRDLRRAILKAKPRAPGPDDIHNVLLKHLPEESLMVLKDILNGIWISGRFPGDGGGRPSSVMSLGVTSVGGHSHGHPASPIGVGSSWEDIDPRSPEPLVVRGGWLWLICVVRWTT